MAPSLEAHKSKGKAPYTLSYRGGETDGIQILAGNATTLSLPVGTYVIEVKDADGCSNFATSSILPVTSDLYCSITPSPTTCNEDNGAINVFISGGKKPYTLTYDGPVSGTRLVNGTTSFDNLPAGNYTTFLQDAEGCSVSESSVVTIGDAETATVEFSPVITGTSVQFFNDTKSTGDFLWTFGDETSSTEISPTHVYQSAGSYEVCLSQAGVCNIDIVCQTIQISAGKETSGFIAPLGSSSFIKEITSKGQLHIRQNYPNPFVQQTNILFELPEALLGTIMIHDNTGKVIQSHTTNYEKGTNFFTFNQNNLASGVYYYTIKAGTFSATKKMILR